MGRSPTLSPPNRPSHPTCPARSTIGIVHYMTPVIIKMPTARRRVLHHHMTSLFHRLPTGLILMTRRTFGQKWFDGAGCPGFGAFNYLDLLSPCQCIILNSDDYINFFLSARLFLCFAEVNFEGRPIMHQRWGLFHTRKLSTQKLIRSFEVDLYSKKYQLLFSYIVK